MLRKIGLAMLFSCLSFVAFAQTGTVRGVVLDDKTNEPIYTASAVIKNAAGKIITGGSTNDNGIFILPKIPVGKYSIEISILGYKNDVRDIEVNKNRTTKVNARLVEDSEIIGDVVLTGRSQEMKDDIRISTIKMQPKKVEQLSVGVDADIAKAIQVLPGVVTTGDQGGQLFIRGGAPVQNKVLLDGMVLYNPFHSIGFFSVFDSDILRSADVYTGGFNVEYGGRISSVMDIRTRAGNTERLAGKLNSSTFLTKFLLEGPIGKKDETGHSKTSFILSYKNSYLDQTSQSIYSYIDEELPYSFSDIYGKISTSSRNGSSFNFFGFNFTDNVNFREQLSDLSWDATGFGSNFVLVPNSSSTLIRGNFNFSNYEIQLQEEGSSRPQRSSVDGFGLGFDFTYFLSGKNTIDYGFEISGFKTDYEFFNSAERRIQQEENTTELSGYWKYKIEAGRWLIEPGVRLHYYASLPDFSFEPRIGLKYAVNEVFRLKASGGIYSQNLIAANSDRDVVNLFYGFLSGSDNIPDDFKGEEINHRLQKAIHYIVGFEYEISKKWDINIEGYIKDFTQLTNVNRNKLFDDNAANIDKPDILKKDFIIEEGFAQGIDVLLRYESKHSSLWISYSLGQVTRDDGIQEFNPHYDRRHNVNIVASKAFGKDKTWEVNARWNFGTGFPFTQTQGFYEEIDFTNGGVNTDPTTQNGEVGIVYGDINEGRLPTYHRLDVAVKKFWELKNNVRIEANFGVTNVYNRENIFFFDRVEFERVNQLPFMPSVGMSVSF